MVPLFAFFIVVNLHPDDKADSILEAVIAHEKILKAIEKGSARCELGADERTARPVLYATTSLMVRSPARVPPSGFRAW